MLPNYFYDLDAVNPHTNEPRWACPYALDDHNDTFIINPAQIRRNTRRNARDKAYRRWMESFNIRPKIMRWQAIRVLTNKHSEQHSSDWWDNYQDALFRVFVNPETIRDKHTRDWKQWYILSPEDTWMINAHEATERGDSFAPRSSFHVISREPHMRAMRIIPVECCHHLRNETKGGELEFREAL